MRQALPLSMKVAMTKTRIREWVNYYGQDGVYISFSGGKDSTVLLHIVREMYPDIEAVFVDVPTQFPELKQFATSFPNVTVVRPKMSYIEVVKKYGFPLISKEISHKFHDLRTAQEHGKESYILRQLEGTYVSKNGKTNMISCQKYKFLLDAPFNIDHSCCNKLKKEPIKKFERQSGKVPITGQMADESMLRTKAWTEHGCNAFDSKRPMSNPMSTWTEQDVLLYIKQHNLPICSVYGEVIVDDSQVDGQMCIADYGKECGMADIGNPKLKTTGCDRTGCVLCGFGCHTKGDTRFADLKSTHPGLYSLIDKIENNGVTMREAIDWLNEHGGYNIKY